MSKRSGVTTAVNSQSRDAAGQVECQTVFTSSGSERVWWSSHAQEVWIAETPGAHLGMVGHNHDVFVPTSLDGRDRAVFSTRSDAPLSVNRHWSRNANPVAFSLVPGYDLCS